MEDFQIMTNQSLTLINLKQRAQAGSASDVDYLMDNLDMAKTLTGYKLLDYALGLVSSAEGRHRIKHFLFNGSEVQRNYAALYFKRRGASQIVDEAVRRGCIDITQAYSQ
jgi:hypothetical protein